jgi:hypothetical protein
MMTATPCPLPGLPRLLLLGCTLLLIQMPGGVEGYVGHRGRVRANAGGAAGGDNYTCYHAPVQPGVKRMHVCLGSVVV